MQLKKLYRRELCLWLRSARRAGDLSCAQRHAAGRGEEDQEGKKPVEAGGRQSESEGLGIG